MSTVDSDPVEVEDLPEADDSLGKLIDQRAAAYDHVKKAEAHLRALKQVVDGLDERIMAKLDELDLPGARGRAASMSIRETTVPVVKDWDALYQYITDNQYFHLLNRAPNAAAFRELFVRGPVPGAEPFIKRSLTFKSL